ncbi:uncharacterized LabA/DUF88 family protein [Actinoplanes lutulentus]|uniref:Uncharacterized LabA/DUF88 family protein n=1 Tax=Actinoplanes lutulentus TaxID=1287878 RepID=A0A327ZFJ6_9ACTN|nr:NYN domain-containing protein [Actinoplanes lutulentus]MBB2942363.1 uncharacterized LabA/DUF88 family protein [Actinoplanes lutulentus]RAK33133.1 uncharacterized LabA/DUF88 family protein [Actinoplanes lutulentus]
MSQTNVRVAAYVDGFNLYNGMHDARRRRSLWLNMESLLGSFLGVNQELAVVHYFTALVQGQSRHHQVTYLDALAAHCPITELHVGRFQAKQLQCRNCHHTRTSYEEKESDVSLAVQLVEDAALDVFDHALIVSGDSDMAPAIRSVRRIAPHKRLVAVFPPRRSSVTLKNTVDATLQIYDRVPERHLLPDNVKAVDGTTFNRPSHWR